MALSGFAGEEALFEHSGGRCPGNLGDFQRAMGRCGGKL
jgi:hypothetical protein